MKILVTGAAGFIGFHTSLQLLRRGHEVVGLDNLNAYYDPSLKRARLDQLLRHPRFSFEIMDVADREAVAALFARERFRRVVHLAAQAGVRYSLENPFCYIDSNLVGFATILEGCRHNGVEHLVYASSSSVYGLNSRMPFSVRDNVDHPISLYAATKKANELMAHAYSHLYRLPTTGLRFFTVYGPWGRPDMAMFLFSRAILEGRPIRVFGNGRMKRDFTYVDDVVEGVVRLVDVIPRGNPRWDGSAPDPSSSPGPYRIFNIGNHNPVELLELIEVLEKALRRTAVKEFLPPQPGDVPATAAEVSDLAEAIGFVPGTPLAAGAAQFVDWFRGYYSL
jgi:UDP-glucuronate 4-epimerase